MKKQAILFYIFFLLTIGHINGQRYFDEVFTDDQIHMISDVHYASNMIGIDPFSSGTGTELEDLFLDVYQPMQNIDSVENRPVVIVCHGGFFLPAYLTGCFGEKEDWLSVTTAKRFARMGFVAVVPNYRVGWNVFAQNKKDFTKAFFDARIRGAQDLKACVRFLKKESIQNGNSYHINENKIVYWGAGEWAGDIVQLAAYAFDEQDFEGAGYFQVDDFGELFPLYDKEETGAIEALDTVINSEGVTVFVPNHTNYSSEVNLVVAANAWAFDVTMFNEGEASLISFANPNLQIFDFEIVPFFGPTGLTTFFYYFSQAHAQTVDNLGLNDLWKDESFLDPVANVSQDNPLTPGNDPLEGLKGQFGDPNNVAPWYWWEDSPCDSINPGLPTSTQNAFPGSTEANAFLQLDSMIRYFTPRACITLNLAINCEVATTNLDSELTLQNEMTIHPNPTSDYLKITNLSNQKIGTVNIYTLDGQLLRQLKTEDAVLEIKDLQLAQGIYLIKIHTGKKVYSEKVLII